MQVFKYLSPDRIDVLKDGHTRFTPPSDFNDPFEAFPYFKAIAPQKNIDAFIEEKGWDQRKIENMLEESWKAQLRKNPSIKIPFSAVKGRMTAIMAQEKPVQIDYFKKFMTMDGAFHRKLAINTLLNAMNQEIGMLCLTEKRDNLLMWAHYTSNHTGFVIQFDTQNSYFDQRKKANEIRGHLKKVRYTKKRPELTLMDPNISKEQTIDRWVNDIFFVKSEHWEYEQEWRMALTLRDCQRVIRKDSYKIHLFPFPKDSVRTVILGCKISKDKKDSIMRIVKQDRSYSHVEIVQAKIDDKEYRLNFMQI